MQQHVVSRLMKNFLAVVTRPCLYLIYAFCTHPAIEERLAQLSIETTVGMVTVLHHGWLWNLAQTNVLLGISFKDSFAMSKLRYDIQHETRCHYEERRHHWPITVQYTRLLFS